MRIAIYNIKGGVGKTALSLNFAFKNNLGLISNDALYPYDAYLPNDNYIQVSPDEKFPTEKKLTGKDGKPFDLVWDLGGYADTRIPAVLRSVDVVIVPTTCKPDQIDITLKSLKNIAQFNKNIIVVANCLKKGEFEKLNLDIPYPVLPINYSKAFDLVWNIEIKFFKFTFF